MTYCSFEEKDGVIVVSHSRIHPLVFGVVFGFGAWAVITMGFQEFSSGGADFWLAMALGAVLFLGSLVPLGEMLSSRAEFDGNAKQVSLTNKGIKAISEKVYQYAEIKRLYVNVIEGTEGEWYTPALELEDGCAVEIGFGFGVLSGAQDTLKELREIAERAGILIPEIPLI